MEEAAYLIDLVNNLLAQKDKKSVQEECKQVYEDIKQQMVWGRFKDTHASFGPSQCHYVVATNGTWSRL